MTNFTIAIFFISQIWDSKIKNFEVIEPITKELIFRCSKRGGVGLLVTTERMSSEQPRQNQKE